MSDDMSMEELADGLALWDEFKPQSGEDWAAVAYRCLTTPPKPENPSPLFAGLLLAMETVMEFAQHDSWRCQHPDRYPWEPDCPCGLTERFRQLGIKYEQPAS